MGVTIMKTCFCKWVVIKTDHIIRIFADFSNSAIDPWKIKDMKIKHVPKLTKSSRKK